MKRKMSTKKFMETILPKNRMYIVRDPKTGSLESVHFVAHGSYLATRPEFDINIKYDKLKIK